MWLIVGLGNPGPDYAGHRHNVGFMALDAIASDWKKAFSAHISEIRMDNELYRLCKPMTFMNRSGQSVGVMSRYYDIPPERVLVLYDELDLAFGKVRVKQGGGNGGHNGIRDIEAHIGKDFWRMRIGIGHPGDKNRVTGYVLHDFSKDEQAFVGDLTRHIARELPVFFAKGFEAFMTKLALVCPPPGTEKED